MKKSRLLGAVCAFLAAISINANADVITDTHITLGDGGPIGQYSLTACQDIPLPCDYTTVWFDKVGKHGWYNILGDSYFGDYSTLTLTAAEIDEGADYYLVPYGAEFTATTIATGQFSPFIVVSVSVTPLDVPFGTFYLGVNTGEGLFENPPPRDVFGWAQFSNSSTGLQMISNAMAYGTDGIVVGTIETIVPVPAAVWLFGSGLIGFIGAARRKVRV